MARLSEEPGTVHKLKLREKEILIQPPAMGDENRILQNGLQVAQGIGRVEERQNSIVRFKVILADENFNADADLTCSGLTLRVSKYDAGPTVIVAGKELRQYKNVECKIVD